MASNPNLDLAPQMPGSMTGFQDSSPPGVTDSALNRIQRAPRLPPPPKNFSRLAQKIAVAKVPRGFGV